QDRCRARAPRNGPSKAGCLYRATARPEDNRWRGDGGGARTMRESARSAANLAAYHPEPAAGDEWLRVQVVDVSTAAGGARRARIHPRAPPIVWPWTPVRCGRGETARIRRPR